MSKFNTREYLDRIHARVDIVDGEIKVYQFSVKYNREIARPITPNTTKHPYGKDITYLLVTLYDPERKKPVTYTLSRLVYLYFISDIPQGYDVDHIDGDTFNNIPENLQLLTRKDNIHKRAYQGNKYKNSLNNWAKNS